MSRRIGDLYPSMRKLTRAFTHLCQENDFQITIYQTARTFRDQAILYRQGHTISEIMAKSYKLKRQYKRPDLARLLLSVGPQYGRFVTRAGPGESDHNWGLAFDAVPQVDKKLIWDTNDPAWKTYGRLVKEAGLKWGGDFGAVGEGWDKPHAYHPTLSWRDFLK